MKIGFIAIGMLLAVGIAMCVYLVYCVRHHNVRKAQPVHWLARVRRRAVDAQRPGQPRRRAARALTPVSGWFEWVDEGGGTRKQPYHIQHADGSPVLCAAIGQFPGFDDEQAEQHGFVIITANSAGGMVDIHDRRPVVLPPDLAREWLDPATPPERAVQIVLH